MAKTDPYDQQFRQTRMMWGLILAAAWILWWWHSNSADETAALAALPAADGLISSASHAWSKGDIEFAFFGKMLAAVISSPLAFVVSNYAARWRVENMKKSEAAKAEHEQNRQIEQQAADLDRIRQSAASEAEKAQSANERHELITRIGDVDSQLLVYEAEQDQERKTRTLLNLTQFVYEIHAKFPGEKLSHALAGDSVLLTMVQNTLSHMRSLGLQDRNFFAVLTGVLPRADASSAPSSETPQGVLPVPVGSGT
jgi:hypothetical protein